MVWALSDVCSVQNVYMQNYITLQYNMACDVKCTHAIHVQFGGGLDGGVSSSFLQSAILQSVLSVQWEWDGLCFASHRSCQSIFQGGWVGVAFQHTLSLWYGYSCTGLTISASATYAKVAWSVCCDKSPVCGLLRLTTQWSSIRLFRIPMPLLHQDIKGILYGWS